MRDVRQDTIFLSFKGKRYVFGHGTEVRNNVHTLHNNRTIVMLTTCQHTKKWQVYRDARCDIDNAEYETWVWVCLEGFYYTTQLTDSIEFIKFWESSELYNLIKFNFWFVRQTPICFAVFLFSRDYFTLMKNSTFCLTPRGRRLGSFR